VSNASSLKANIIEREVKRDILWKCWMTLGTFVVEQAINQTWQDDGSIMLCCTDNDVWFISRLNVAVYQAEEAPPS
jgi:hypothetical protein